MRPSRPALGGWRGGGPPRGGCRVDRRSTGRGGRAGGAAAGRPAARTATPSSFARLYCLRSGRGHARLHTRLWTSTDHVDPTPPWSGAAAGGGQLLYTSWRRGGGGRGLAPFWSVGCPSGQARGQASRSSVAVHPYATGVQVVDHRGAGVAWGGGPPVLPWWCMRGTMGVAVGEARGQGCAGGGGGRGPQWSVRVG